MRKQSFFNGKYLLILTLGILLGGAAIHFLPAIFFANQLQLITSDTKGANGEIAQTTHIEKPPEKPLYWVAPMDSSFRRDQPGKSPMGMDLVPVYAKKNTSNVDQHAIYIAPDVVHNLGVRTAQVLKQKLPSEITAMAYVTVDQSTIQHLHSRISGWVSELFVDSTGEQVSKGQALFSVYSPELVNAQEEFLLILANRDLQQIKSAEKRLLALSISAQAIEQLKNNKQVQKNVVYYAEQAGFIERLAIRVGFFITPNMNVLSIAQLSNVWLEAQIFSAQIAQVAVGMPVTVFVDALPELRWQSVIDYIYPTVDSTSQTLRARIKLPNVEQKLKLNMYAKVVIDTTDKQERLVIAKQALIRTGKQDRVVLALGDGFYKSVEVNVGRITDDFVEIIDGLAVGDQVVNSGHFLIDSESSKSSDFKRMQLSTHLNEHANNHHNLVVHNEMIEEKEPSMAAVHNKQLSSATVTGQVISVMPKHRMVSIYRQAIEKWSRPAAEVDFIVSDNIDMALFKPENTVEFTFVVDNGEFIIREINSQVNRVKAPMAMPKERQ